VSVAELPPQHRAQQRHYRTYAPTPFTREQRADTEILFGGLHWRAEHLIKATFENLGYKARVLPTATKEDLLRGRELADIGQCCPTSFVTGNLAGFLQKEADRIGPEAVADKYVYLTAGACGACRFGQYHQSYELALRNVGLEAFRLFLIEQNRFDQGSLAGGGLEMNLPLTMGAVWGVLCADVVQGLEYRTRPYEVVSGQTDEVVRESMAYLSEVFRNRPKRGKKWGTLAWHLSTNYFINALREVYRRFEAIEVDRLQPKPVVKITGEFYLQTVEGDPNYNIHRWLESEGAEVYPAPIAVWLDYLIRVAAQKARGVRRHRPSCPGQARGGAHAAAGLPLELRPDAPGARRHPPRDAPAGGTARARRALFPPFAVGRRGRHADRQGAVVPSPQQGAHDLRTVALCLHAQHHEHRRHGRGDRQVSRPALCPDRGEGRFGSACPVALPDDPHRGQEARHPGIRPGHGEERADAGDGQAAARRQPGDEAGDLQRAAHGMAGMAASTLMHLASQKAAA
jgi:hypothetical protein